MNHQIPSPPKIPIAHKQFFVRIVSLFPGLPVVTPALGNTSL